jgi:hypothetical protein
VSIDLHDKLQAYRRNGVREYVVWRVQDESIDSFVLRRRKYTRLATSAAGVLRSEVLPGLWLDVPAVLRGDWQAAAQTRQKGLATAEHAAFVRRLQQHSKRAKP